MFTRFLYRVVFAALSVFAVLSVFAALPVFAASVDDLSTDKITLVFDRTLPNVPGKSMRGVLVEYQPGGSSPAHTHPNSSFIYATVLKGVIRSKVNDEPEKCITLARALPKYLAIIMVSAQMTVTLNPHAYWPSSSSILTKRT